MNVLFAFDLNCVRQLSRTSRTYKWYDTSYLFLLRIILSIDHHS